MKNTENKFQVEVITQTQQIFNTDADTIEAALSQARKSPELLELHSESSEVSFRVARTAELAFESRSQKST